MHLVGAYPDSLSKKRIYVDIALKKGNLVRGLFDTRMTSVIDSKA